MFITNSKFRTRVYRSLRYVIQSYTAIVLGVPIRIVGLVPPTIDANTVPDEFMKSKSHDSWNVVS